MGLGFTQKHRADILLPREQYDDLAALLAAQSSQRKGWFYRVVDASGFDDVNSGAAIVLYLGTTNGTQADYQLTGNSNSSSQIQQKTGTNINFSENASYNAQTYLTSGNLILDLTDAVAGVNVICYCDGYKPSISGETFKYGSGLPLSSGLNILSFLYDGFNIILNSINIQPLLAPLLNLTPGDSEIQIDWSSVLNADNYVIQRDTDSEFGSPIETYNGALLTDTDTGLTNETVYCFRSKSQGVGFIDSEWGEVIFATPNDGTLISSWDASVNESIENVDGLVTQVLDLSGNGHTLTASENAPTHSDSNDNITHIGVNNVSHKALSDDISQLDFQQGDDFTILIKGLKINSGVSTGQRILHNASSDNANGWYVITNAANDTIYIVHKDATTPNLASYVNGAGWNDDTERDFFFINESGVLKIYDATNTNVGTNGSTSIGAITYGSTEFKIGVGNLSTSFGASSIGWKKIKTWSKALSESDRNNELGL